MIREDIKVGLRNRRRREENIIRDIFKIGLRNRGRREKRKEKNTMKGIEVIDQEISSKYD